MRDRNESLWLLIFFFLIVYIGVCLIIKLIYLQNKVVENMEKHEGENIVIHIITIQR